MGSGCHAMCTHTPLADSTGCMMGSAAGACLAGACCTGCVKNGVCLPGSSDAKACGAGGNSCFDCTQNSATATCNAGNCSGCDATSCTSEGRSCGTSSCGYNCGGCPDSCMNGGTLTHYSCVGKACQPQNPPTNCGLYSTCASANACNTSCVGDTDCLANAFCDPASHACKPKSGLGGSCSAEGTGDHECTPPYVCAWRADGNGAACAASHCSGCFGISSVDWKSCIWMAYGKDPRGYCPYRDVCHANFCDGAGNCDSGYDSYQLGADYRPCGAATCTVTDPAAPASTVTGTLCTPNGCQTGQTQMRCCLCNSSHTAVDTTTCQRCD